MRPAALPAVDVRANEINGGTWLRGLRTNVRSECWALSFSDLNSAHCFCCMLVPHTASSAAGAAALHCPPTLLSTFSFHCLHLSGPPARLPATTSRVAACEVKRAILLCARPSLYPSIPPSCYSLDCDERSQQHSGWLQPLTVEQAHYSHTGTQQLRHSADTAPNKFHHLVLPSPASVASGPSQRLLRARRSAASLHVRHTHTSVVATQLDPPHADTLPVHNTDRATRSRLSPLVLLLLLLLR